METLLSGFSLIGPLFRRSASLRVSPYSPYFAVLFFLNYTYIIRIHAIRGGM